MKNNNLKDLDLELKNTIDEIKLIEKKLSHLNELMENTKNDIDLNLDFLHSLRNKEKNIKENIFSIRKKNINDALKIDDIKKFLSNPTPVIDDAKNKITDSFSKVKGFIDGSHFENIWLNDKYNEYKKYCIDNGLKFKNQKYFKNIMLPLRKKIDKSSSIKDFYIYLDKEEHQLSKKASEAIKLIDENFEDNN